MNYSNFLNDLVQATLGFWNPRWLLLEFVKNSAGIAEGVAKSIIAVFTWNGTKLVIPVQVSSNGVNSP